MSTPAHTWHFFRTGGLDQVALTTGADLLALEHLDQKLWVALACPVKGLELDEKTLALIDTDGDGRIRVPELLAAITWSAAHLSDVGTLLAGTDGLPLAALNLNTSEGRAVHASAKQILANLGKKNATTITIAESADTAKIFAASPLNGDGVIPPEAAAEAATKQLITDMIASTGGTADRTGSLGVTAADIEKFFVALADYAAWATSAAAAVLPLGEQTSAASAAIAAVRAKIDDFFARCRLAAFDARALAALNRSETEFLAIAAKELTRSAAEVAGFPLARIEAGRTLPLLDGVNPAWSAALATLHAAAVTPIFGAAKTTLTTAEWADLQMRFTAHDAWAAAKAGAACEKLGLARAQEILASKGRDALATLLAEDLSLAPQFAAIASVERLARYHRDLRSLLHNFVNFADFYSRDRWAVFQAGTLFLDGRSTEFCVRIDAPNPFAVMSKAYIAYCSCTRAGCPPMNIAACFTQGDSDYLFVGRHGVFYDRAGRDWDAVITGIVDNPISIRQALWSPYKKFLRMIEEQVAKRAAAAEAASNARLATAAEKTANADAFKGEPPKKVDVGAVAAIGVAISGAVTAITLILGYVFALKFWQYPLVLVGLVLVISAPSMLIAWLKLRQRTLGPLLEGNGWAVNGRVKINIPFGTALTDVAVLPAGSHRSLEDPYEDKAAAKQKRRVTFVVLVVLLAAAALWVRWNQHQTGR
jgi:hypothetical protein